MANELKQFIDILSQAPEWALIAGGLYVIFHLVIYLSTIGAVVYLGKEVIKLLGNFLNNVQRQQHKKHQVYYHGLVKEFNSENKEWFYNRTSLDELGEQGVVLKFYTTEARQPVIYP